ncbi:hypothetical protein [Ruegeria hyattellae]|uniref:hypothetical protein n=1 Tax=Ruegeria hyattellae TaxID=3233337 RepID=UPI00355C1CD3
MTHPTDRRTLLVSVGAAAITAFVDTAAAQTNDIRGLVKYEGGAVIPDGHISIYLNDPANQERTRAITPNMYIESDGKSKVRAFAFSWPTSLMTSPTLQIVARLEREDGWLLARGSTQFQPGSPVHITLNRALY